MVVVVVTDPCAPGAGVFLYEARRVLLILHAAGSIVLIGAATHHARLMRKSLRGRFERLEKTYAKVVSIAYLVTFALGALVYPSYRVHVRGEYLDRFAPAYAGLFDAKEMYATLCLIPALALGALAFVRGPTEPVIARITAVLSYILCAVVWFNVIAGLLVVSVRGVG